jgi:hypothetical protein
VLKGFGVDPADSAKDSRTQMRSLISEMAGILGKKSPILDQLRKLGTAMVGLAKKQDRAANQYDKAVEHLAGVRAKSADYASSVTEAYRHDPFGGNLGDFSLQLRADRNDANEARRDLAEARRKGLSGALLKQLQASGNTALIDQFSKLSRREIERYENLYKAQQDATRVLGANSAQAIYGQEIRESIRERKETRQTLNRLNHRLDQMEHRIEKGAYKGVRDGVRDRNHRDKVARKGGKR